MKKKEHTTDKHLTNITILDSLIGYNNFLKNLSKNQEPFSGIKPIRLCDNPEIMSKESAKKVLRVLLEDLYKTCDLTTSVECKCREIQLILGINREESSSIIHSAIKKAYREALRQCYASSPKITKTNASLINKYCISLNLNQSSAIEIHESILKQRLIQLVEKGTITTSDEIELNNLRLFLCINKKSYNNLKNELCGRSYKRTIKEFFKKGLYTPGIESRKIIRDKMIKLRIDNETAIKNLDEVARKVLMQFVVTYRSKTNSLEAIKELRNMILFYDYSVTPIIDNISTYHRTIPYLKQESYNLTGSVAKKEIELTDDIELKDRINLYKKFFHHCVTGNVIELGLGSAMVLEHDQKEFTYLHKLSTILGLSQNEITEIHQSMAESAFKTQVRFIISDGILSDKKMKSISDLKKKLGISDSGANSIIKNIQTSQIKDRHKQETFSINQILELTQQGTDIESIATEKTRMKIFRQEIDKALSDGTGLYDGHKFTVVYPKLLKLDNRIALSVVEEIASDKFRKSFVQAISHYRNKKYSELVNTVQNMVSQYRAFPNIVTWEKKDEINKLFELYLRQTNLSPLYDEVAKTLGLSVRDAEEIVKTVNSSSRENMINPETEKTFSYFN